MLLALFICLSFSHLLSQSKSSLEAQRKNLTKRIDLTTDLLQKNKASAKKAIEDYETMNGQIENRNALIIILNEELALTDSLVKEQEKVVQQNQYKLDTLQLEYGAMMRQALRHKLQESRLQFILSGASLTEYYHRWRFLKVYQENRQRQLELIVEEKQHLEEELEALRQLFEDKETLLLAEEYQNELLAIDVSLQANTLKALKNDEAQLRESLRSQEVNRQQIDKNIQAIIQEGIAKNNKARVNSLTKNRNQPSGSVRAAESFAQARGQLSWPVDKGVIIKKFGTQRHPTLRGITISNNGIDIRSQSGSAVRAVFDGTVVQTQQVSGNANILVIAHGRYYTVYANLAQVNVQQGDPVKMGQTIGFLNRDPLKNADLHFEIWKEKQRLNPIKWISK